MSTERIPSRLNAVLLAATSLVSGGALWVASHAAQGWLVLLAALVFSYAANALFALLHEAVHGVLFENPSANTWGGRLASAWFPTGLALQRAFHLNHHQHNRDPSERFDYLQPGESRWLKHAQWYCILTGAYWVFAVVGGLAWFVAPVVFRLARSAPFAKQTASATYF